MALESTLSASIGPASLTGSLLDMGILTDSGAPTTTNEAMYVLAGNSTTVTTTIAGTGTGIGLVTGSGTLTDSNGSPAANAAPPMLFSNVWGLAAILL